MIINIVIIIMFIHESPFNLFIHSRIYMERPSTRITLRHSLLQQVKKGSLNISIGRFQTQYQHLSTGRSSLTNGPTMKKTSILHSCSAIKWNKKSYLFHRMQGQHPKAPEVRQKSSWRYINNNNNKNNNHHTPDIIHYSTALHGSA